MEISAPQVSPPGFSSLAPRGGKMKDPVNEVADANYRLFQRNISFIFCWPWTGLIRPPMTDKVCTPFSLNITSVRLDITKSGSVKKVYSLQFEFYPGSAVCVLHWQYWILMVHAWNGRQGCVDGHELYGNAIVWNCFQTRLPHLHPFTSLNQLSR